MLQVGKIKIRDIAELQGDDVITPNNALSPLRKRKNLKPTTISKKQKEQEHGNETVIECVTATTTTITKTSRKKLTKCALKETPCNQKLIDSYFTSCPKTYDIKLPKQSLLPTPVHKSKDQITLTNAKGKRNIVSNKKNRKSPRRSKARRKRLFTDSTEPSAENMSATNFTEAKHAGAVECIIIDSDSDGENDVKKEAPCSTCQTDFVRDVRIPESVTKPSSKISLKSSSPTTSSSLSFGLKMSKTSCENAKSVVKSTSDASNVSRRKTKPCPSYKVVEDTTFAVDAFQFGSIENVTHYFLTHFHADHYIGLTKSFAMPLYVSPITARLLRAFIPVQEQYIHVLELNEPCIINNIKVTALDANHCPGAILLVFEFLDSHKCILHTGDFRAHHDMESEPIFWNKQIHTIYLDTTYISDKYAFCTQYESIMKAQDLIDKFLDKHNGKRILFICGSYVIGKEKFWSSLAENYQMKVWAEGNRYKALKAINEERFNSLLVEDAHEANMHVIPMAKLSYLELVEYFKLYEQQYDILFAMRPSGWEKDTKPRYGPKINLVGIEYSEHSSYAEMQRFVKFLKPEKVISTVPTGKDLMKTSTVPISWYNYNELKASSNYQPSIDSFLGKTPQKQTVIRLANVNKDEVDYFVSPLKLSTPNKSNINLQQQKETSINSSPLKTANEKIEELCSKNKLEPPKQNFSNNLQNNNANRSKTKATAISVTNSSEDFEKSDFIMKTKARNKNNLLEKAKSNQINITPTKPQRNKKQLRPKNTNIKVHITNSEELFEMPDKQLTIHKKPQRHERVGNIAENELITSADVSLNEQDFDICSSQKRLTRSQKAVSNFQTVQYDQLLNSKSLINSPTSQRNHNHKSSSNINSTSTEEDLKIPTSQKRMTRSNTASTKASISFASRSEAEEEFEAKLLKLSNQNNQIVNTTLNIHSKQNFAETNVNPIFKSTTDSTLDSISAKEIPIKSLKRKENTLNFSPSRKNCFNNFEYSTKSAKCKRSALNHSLTPFKRDKLKIDTQTILNTILEQREDIDRFNCSQLAGLVVEAVNKHNPDYSKDHIPADLLSDADDDWM